MLIRGSNRRLPDAVLACLPADEAEGAQEVSQRADTACVWIEGTDGAPLGYAVFGMDKGGMLAVYFARSMVRGLGPVMMKQFFGVAQVAGVPLRMHAQSLRDIQVKARMFGATVAFEAHDSDGILQGVFDRVQ